VPSFVTVGLLICVMLRLFQALLPLSTKPVSVGAVQDAQPGRNSLTVPVTRTRSPTATVGALPVNTKMPSEVAGSPSPTGSCMKKLRPPAGVTAVTIPSTLPTICPRKLETWPAPWMSAIVTAV
jgi:hypothetical protein